MARYPDVFFGTNLMTFEEARMLCQYSYSSLEPGQTIEGEGVQWTVAAKHTVGGFAAYVIDKPDGFRAIVYRGTVDWRGWILNNIPNMFGMLRPPQYDTGVAIASQYNQWNTMLVGHSLGGGIATYASAHLGLPAVTIFPAPVIPSSLPDRGGRAKVYNYVCHGEALTELTAGGRRDSQWNNNLQDGTDFVFSRQRHRRLGVDNWVQSIAGNAIAMHGLDSIAA